MKFSEKDRQHNWELFQQMSLKEKLSHIWLYYKPAFLLITILAVILVSVIHTAVTRKEPVLYAAYANMTLNEETEQQLWEDYLTARGYVPEKTEVYLHRDLLLSDFPSAELYEQTYGSYMKVMALIECQELDIILMDREAYDFCSTSGYLLDLTTLFPADDPRISPYAVSNLVVLEDNGDDYSLGLAEEYICVTDTVCNALELTRIPWIQELGLSGEVYLGIIQNSPRPDACVDYIDYLTGK